MRIQVKLQPESGSAIFTNGILFGRMRDVMSLEFTVINERFATSFKVADVCFFFMLVCDVSEHSRPIEESFGTVWVRTKDGQEFWVDFVVVYSPIAGDRDADGVFERKAAAFLYSLRGAF